LLHNYNINPTCNGALFTLTANQSAQIIVVSGVDEQPMTGTRKKAKRTKSKRRCTPQTKIPAVSVQGKYFCRVDRTCLANFEDYCKIGKDGKGKLRCLNAPRGIEGWKIFKLGKGSPGGRRGREDCAKN